MYLQLSEMEFFISDAIRLKLKLKHRVNDEEIIECFENRTGEILIDKREQHRTYPPTKWFIAQTDTGRELKIVFIQTAPTKIVIKTAYAPNETVKKLYNSKSRE